MKLLLELVDQRILLIDSRFSSRPFVDELSSHWFDVLLEFMDVQLELRPNTFKITTILTILTQRNRTAVIER